jgi:hypothetical protein
MSKHLTKIKPQPYYLLAFASHKRNIDHLLIYHFHPRELNPQYPNSVCSPHQTVRGSMAHEFTQLMMDLVIKVVFEYPHATILWSQSGLNLALGVHPAAGLYPQVAL